MPLSKQGSRNPVSSFHEFSIFSMIRTYFLITLLRLRQVATMIRSVFAVFLLYAYITPSSAGFVVCRSKSISRWPLKSNTGAGHVAESLALMSTRVDDVTREEMRAELLELIGDTPRNAPTPKRTTEEILAKIRRLEYSCPTAEEDVLNSLGGAWELLWTAQVGLLCRCQRFHLL